MAVSRVFGRVDGVEVILNKVEGDRWSVPVPFDSDGEYVVEIVAEDEAGNQTYLAKMLYTVDAGNICVHALPMPKYLFLSQHEEFVFKRQPSGFMFGLVYPICQGVAL